MPICILYAVNIAFFTLTALKIRRVQREVKSCFLASRVDSTKHQDNFDNAKYNYTLYLRLFILTGMTWSVDSLAFISQDHLIFLVTDICNSLHGVFIFVLFIMKRRVFSLIKDRLVSVTLFYLSVILLNAH